jgi:hypothetical protein
MTPRKHARASPRRNSAAPRGKPASRCQRAAPRSKPTPPRRTAPSRRQPGAGAANKGARPPSYYTAEFMVEAKRRVEQTLQSTTSLAADLGMHHGVLSKLIQRLGWVRPEGSLHRRGLTPPMRLAAAADALVQGAEQQPSAHSRASGNPGRIDATGSFGSEALGPRFRGDERHDNPGADLSAVDRLEQAVLKELTTVETMRASLGAEPLRPMDAERTARTLSTLTETLAKLRRLRLGAQPQSETTDDDIPDIDAFRLDLARRIDLFVASWTDAPDGDGDPAAVAVDEAR